MPPSSLVGVSPLRSRIRRTAQLVLMLAPRELRVRYRQSVLDVAWALISPIVTMIVYGLVLTQSFDVTGGCGPYLSSAWVGLVAWTFFATALGTSVTSLISSSDMISKVYFPREAIPLAMAGSALVDLAIGMSTVLLVMIVQGIPLRWAALTFLFPIAVLVVWSAALSVVVAVLAAFIRDVIHGVNLALRVGFFATPVMYEVDFLPRQLAWTAEFNPLAVAITGLREVLLCGQLPDATLLLTHLVLGLAVLFGAILYTRSVESRIADVV